MNGGENLCGRQPRSGRAIGMLYSLAMASGAGKPPTGFKRVFAWRRLRFTLAVSAALGFVTGIHSTVPMTTDLARFLFMGCMILFVFGVTETRPGHLPKWLPRTVFRLLCIVFVIPVTAAFMAAMSPGNRDSLGLLFGTALLFAPWIAIGAILRERDLRCASRRSPSSSSAASSSDRRSMRACAAAGAGRAAFPLQHAGQRARAGGLRLAAGLDGARQPDRLPARGGAAPAALIDDARRQELQLVRAYLELMQMRMPDRLQFALQVDPAALRALIARR